MKRIAFASVLLVACFSSGLRGSGQSATETRPLATFKRIDLRGSTDVEVTVGEPQKVVVSGDDNLVPKIRTHIENESLVVEMESGSYSPKLRDLVTVTLPTLEAVSIHGSGDITAHRLTADHFRAQISGSGDLSAEGQVAALEATISGSGDMDLSSLTARSAEITIMGSGDAKLHPTDSLKATISGSGDIRYKGTPKTKDVEIHGSGSVEPE